MERINLIGKKFGELRKKCGFTQAVIANYLEVDQSLISKFESGDRTLSVDALEKLATVFGVCLSDLEKEETPSPTITLAFRAGDLTVEDVKTIGAINRIALNAYFMDSLLQEN